MHLSSVGVDWVHNEWVESEHVCRDAAMRDTFAQSETNRIKRFYQSRFKGSADNLVIAFRKLVDGIDVGKFENIAASFTQWLLTQAAHASRLPNQMQTDTLALIYAAFLENMGR